LVRVQPGELPLVDRHESGVCDQATRVATGRQLVSASQVQRDAVKAYDNRLVGITKLQGKIQAEHQRLQNLLG
jgi:hypothetical protein